MDHDLETIRWYVDHLMKNADPDARAELRRAFESLDQRLQSIESALAELQRPTDQRQRDILDAALTDLAAETAQRQLETTGLP